MDKIFQISVALRIKKIMAYCLQSRVSHISEESTLKTHLPWYFSIFGERYSYYFIKIHSSSHAIH